MGDKARLYLDQAGEFRWVRTAANGREVGAASEGYKNEADAVDNYERTNGPDAPELEGKSA